MFLLLFHEVIPIFNHCITITYSWSWDSEPAFEGTDVIGVGWDQTMYFEPSKSNCKLTYQSSLVNGGTSTSTLGITIVSYSSNVCMKVPMYVTQPIGHKWCKAGSGTIVVSKAGYVPEMSTKFGYGHSTINVSPSISISGDGLPGLGFSFTSNVTEIDSSNNHYLYDGTVK